MAKAVIIDATRTPIGRYGGSLLPFKAADLGAHCVKALMERNGIEPQGMIDNVIMGQVLQGGSGQITARQVLIKAGLDPTTPGLLINKVCASGMRAITLAATLIEAGENQLVFAGGYESMSNAPYYSFDTRWGARMFDKKLVDGMVYDGLWCAFENVHMAVEGNMIAREFEIPRKEQDQFAYQSQMKTKDAIQSGRLAEEITPVEIPQKKGDPIIFDTDEHPRPDTTLEKLAKLKPIFEENGTITAGNAPGVNDGGAALLVGTEEWAKRLGKKPLARIIAWDYAALKPYQFPIAPAEAVKKLLKKTCHKIDDFDLIECNEAFAAVVLANQRILEWDPEKVNVNGGAIALGHPIGMSGARITMTLAYELRRRGGGLGLACICSGSGQGDAIIIEVEP